MKRKHEMMLFGVAVSLIFFLLSCAGVKERPAEEAPAASEVAVEETSAAAEVTAEEADLLIGTHKTAGISCSDCHAESPPAGEVSGASCLNCHEDYQELTAELYFDPHNAHMSFPDCVNCHHVHQAGENQCLACHAF